MTLQYYHPIAVIIFYMSAIFVAVATKQPMILCTVLTVLVLHQVIVYPKWWQLLTYYTFVSILIVLISLAFKHNGVTPLFFWNDQAVTKEVLVWAIAFSGILIILRLLFECILHDLSLARMLFACRLLWTAFAINLAFALRFLPTVKTRYRTMHRTQKAIGYYATVSKFDQLVGIAKTMFEATVWSFDQCFRKQDVMRARGYALKHKTTFKPYKWQLRDTCLTVASCIISVWYIWQYEQLRYYYFPMLKSLDIDTGHVVIIALFVAIPFLLQLKERVTWHYYNSKM